MSNQGQVTTAELSKKLGKPHVKIVDTRPVEAYNGWRLRGEQRGGHIQTAKSLPAKWTSYIDLPDIVRSKGIEPDDEVILYGYDAQDCERPAKCFNRAGFGNISVYNGFLNEWSADDSLPMSRLERYKNLVSAQWLKDLITNTAAEYDNDNFVICHAHYRNPDAYTSGHIPSAIPLDTNWLESSETWNRRSPQELQQTLQNLGITHETTVILYGRFSFPKNSDSFPGSSAGQLAAMRCAAIMMYAGVRNIRILNGGLQAWLDEEFDLSTEEIKPKPVSSFGRDIPANPNVFIDTPQAKQVLRAEDQNLVSVRSWPEFIGKVSGYNYIEKTGRIPGAVFGNCGSDAYHMENYRNLDHTTREYHEIEQLWKQAGITPDKLNAFYCGTGWRGSEAFMNAWLMDWPRICVYDGGWFEWSSDPANPIEIGEPATSMAS
ncbi:Thiosulfate sulfurtransferase YnjE precursor [Anaerohalosphaera lusitana]|uniref:Thiosulfate sulfurtransferase YnjE n=1 Tax=Anaerohalosphaera lusitana TaxID=1936003 RepID=A0A1U9NRA5_9BACT|nr:rhodanese-like domain-containing protein [Anaerohalosphaera lusitana]AQT70150.1 Thiosulfate sulfurtransferase YnjE precursor [Anaerohalosphaera lusitana]